MILFFSYLFWSFSVFFKFPKLKKDIENKIIKVDKKRFNLLNGNLIKISDTKLVIKIIINKIVEIITILLKWYKKEILLEKIINKIGDNIDAIKPIKKILIISKSFLKIFCK